jgi:hypothetical protein
MHNVQPTHLLHNAQYMDTTDRHHAAQRRAIWPPEPGHFSLRLVRRGWPVPAAIHCQDGLWWADIDGRAYPRHADPAHAAGVDRIWHGGLRVAEHEHRFLIALKEWAQTHQPDHPCLHPLKPINPALLRPIMPDLSA